MSALERDRKHFFRKPAVEKAELALIADVLQVVIDNGHVPHALFQRMPCGCDGKFRALSRIVDARELGSLAPKGVTENVADLAALVSRKPDGSIRTEFQSEMPNARSGRKIGR